jgi:ADP-ribose pyrophosphatase YjhB (NUDIX family)
VTAIVPNDRGELLMVHKTDNDLWALPGGGMDLGEYMAEAVAREVLEETGVEVEVTGVVGIYTNPRHVMAYDDGEVRQQCSVCASPRAPSAGSYVPAARPRKSSTSTRPASTG